MAEMEGKTSLHVKISGDKRKLSCEEVEKCFANVIKTIDNSAVGEGLSYCGLLCIGTYESLRQILTIYQISCLNINIILCMDKADFDKLCGYIDSREQVKDLSELYFAYQLLLATFKDFGKSECKGHHDLFLGYSSINLKFFYLTQRIQTMIKSPLLLLDNCKRLMASKTYAIPLFDEGSLKIFSAISDNPAILFQALGIFWTWTDHSILKELLHMGKHTEAISLLDEFDQYLESFKTIPIENFPLPILSPRMVPLVNCKQMCTIVAIKCKNTNDACTWHNIFELYKLLKNIFNITRNAMQLLGVLNSNFEHALLYFMVPVSVISLITSKVTHLECCRVLVKNTITEVAIHPNALFTADGSLNVGPLSFFMDTEKLKKIPKHSKKDPSNLVSYLSNTQELPEILQMLLKELNSTQMQMTQIAFEKKELSIKNKSKDATIEGALKENAELQGTIAALKKEVKKFESNKEDHNKKAAANYEQVQTELLESNKLLEEYEAKIEALQQENMELLQNNKLLKEYEEKIKTLQEEKEKTESELKTSVESLKDQLSNLESEVMMKTAHNEQLSKDKASLTKHINSLKERENEKIRSEEENRMQYENIISNLQAEKTTLTENIDRLESLSLERDNAMKLLNEQRDKIEIDLIAKNEDLRSSKRSLEQQLEKNQQEIEGLKYNNLLLVNNNSSLQCSLNECQQYWRGIVHESNMSAKHALNCAGLLVSQPTRDKPPPSRKKKAPPPRPPGVHDGNESSTSVCSQMSHFSATSISTYKTVPTDEPEDETRSPEQPEDSFVEDNENMNK